MNINSVNNASFGANYSAVIKNPLGLHMKPSAFIARLTSAVDQPIYFSAEGAAERNVRNSIIGIMTLEPICGKKISVRVDDGYPKHILNAVLDSISAGNDTEASKIFAKINLLG
ncbi:MAG: HPr family phosphocarrier protein [bacterium]|nr:HPr family phosphocarrier protein [bacterium]